MLTRETLFTLDETGCLGGMPWTGPGVFAREAGGNESPLVCVSFQVDTKASLCSFHGLVAPEYLRRLFANTFAAMRVQEKIG